MTAVLLALGAALAFAVSVVVQHRAATVEVPDGAGGLRFLGRLLRRPAWLAGQAAAGAGFLLHALALRGGTVVLVQPLLSLGLVLTLALGVVVDHRQPGRPLPGRAHWVAAAVVTGGLALFAAAAHPAAGSGTAPAGAVVTCALGALLVAGAAHLWARRPEAPHRAAALGVAAGTGFGITGLLLKQVVGLPVAAGGASGALPMLLLVGAVSVLMAQRAYQAGPLVESLPATTVLEPLVATVLAGALYGEHLAPGLLAHVLQVGGATAAAAGLVHLARRSTGATPVPPAAPQGNRAMARARG